MSDGNSAYEVAAKMQAKYPAYFHDDIRKIIAATPSAKDKKTLKAINLVLFSLFIFWAGSYCFILGKKMIIYEYSNSEIIILELLFHMLYVFAILGIILGINQTNGIFYRLVGTYGFIYLIMFFGKSNFPQDIDIYNVLITLSQLIPLFLICCICLGVWIKIFPHLGLFFFKKKDGIIRISRHPE